MRGDSSSVQVPYPMEWQCRVCGRHLLTAFVRIEEICECSDCGAWTDFGENLALQQGGTEDQPESPLGRD